MSVDDSIKVQLEEAFKSLGIDLKKMSVMYMRSTSMWEPGAPLNSCANSKQLSQMISKAVQQEKDFMISLDDSGNANFSYPVLSNATNILKPYVTINLGNIGTLLADAIVTKVVHYFDELKIVTDDSRSTFMYYHVNSPVSVTGELLIPVVEGDVTAGPGRLNEHPEMLYKLICKIS